MRVPIAATILLGALVAGPISQAQTGQDIPGDFPQFVVPGHEEEMASLRELYYLHYTPAGPLSTLWDEWISGPSLWPAVENAGRMHSIRERWADALSARIIDPEGYVATHQHASIAHQLGWPFPFWKQGGPGTWGWHFSLAHVPKGWHATEKKTQEGWVTQGCGDLGIDSDAWNLRLSQPSAFVRTPSLTILPDQSPFIQLRWRATGLGNAQPFLEWTNAEAPEFSSERRFYFAPPPDDDNVTYTMIPVFKSPAWNGTITKLGINFDNGNTEATAGIQALFTQYDTRHNINNQNFIRGCVYYFQWTRDLNFLRKNLPRIRTALRYMMDDLGGRREKCIVTPFVGHDGRSGLEWTPEGEKKIHSGRGVGNNYWDLLPMGRQDAYATMHYYDSLLQLASLEEDIQAHPEWNLPTRGSRVPPEELRQHAQEVKAFAGALFWNPKTGRFVCGIDDDGRSYDYGFTFINCEAIHYGFATESQAESILKWLNGDRIVEGDTSTGDDIYHWRFGPRSTTKRNIEYYGWFWSGPETIPWGFQVQDGGGVLGFSYHDLQSRLKVCGPGNAWNRLQEVIAWFDEVQAGGGYREYYKDGTRGTLQGGGPPGGLGLDREFFESVLVPQIVINGFLGFRARGDGFEIDPRLPDEWPELRVTRIHLHRLVLDISATQDAITVSGTGASNEDLYAYLPTGNWQIQLCNSAGQIITKSAALVNVPNGKVPIQIQEGAILTLTRMQ